MIRIEQYMFYYFNALLYATLLKVQTTDIPISFPKLAVMFAGPQGS